MRLQLLGGTGKYPGDPRGSVKLLLLTQTATNRIYVQWSTSIRIAIQIIAAGVGTQDILVAGTRHCLVEVGLRIGRHCRLLGPDLQQTLKKAPGRVRRRLETQLTGGGHQGTSPRSTSGDEVPPRQKSTIIARGFLRYIAVPPLEETTVHHIHVAGLQRLLRVSQFRDALHIQHKASIETPLDAAYGSPSSSAPVVLIAILEIWRTVDGVAVGAAIRWPDPVEYGNENGG